MQLGDHLTFDDIHDNGWVYANNELIGTFDRRHAILGFEIDVSKDYDENVELTILVEGMGRINFAERIFD